jgi:hypothetical protein
MNAKINNVIYMKLYTGAKMVDDKYEKTNVAGSIDREFTVPGKGLGLVDPQILVTGTFISG